LGQHHGVTADQLQAFIALSSRGHSQGSGIGQQDKLRDPHPGVALEILQSKIAFHPGEMAFDIAARGDHQTTPPSQEEQGDQLALAGPAQVRVLFRPLKCPRLWGFLLFVSLYVGVLSCEVHFRRKSCCNVLQTLDLACDQQCIIDSLPVPVVQFYLVPGSSGDWRAFGARFGKVPSKKETIFGYKLHLLITLGGLILDFELAPANASDLEVGFELLSEHTDLEVLGDKGYISAEKATNCWR